MYNLRYLAMSNSKKCGERKWNKKGEINIFNFHYILIPIIRQSYNLINVNNLSFLFILIL